MKKMITGIVIGAVIGGVVGSIANDDMYQIKRIIAKNGKKLAKMF